MGKRPEISYATCNRVAELANQLEGEENRSTEEAVIVLADAAETLISEPGEEILQMLDDELDPPTRPPSVNAGFRQY